MNDERATAAVPYRARFDECGPDAAVRASVLLRWAQDVAWIHSERLGFGREWYTARGLAWLVRGLELTVRQPIPMGATVTVTTRVTGFRRVLARRRTEIVLADGSLAADGHTDWVMTDVDRGQPIRVPADFPALFAAPPGGFEPTRVAPSTPPDRATERRFQARPHELDPMAHANNATFLDWLEEAVTDAGGRSTLDARPRTYRLEYRLPAALGDDLGATAWSVGDGAWGHLLLRYPDEADAPAVTLLRGELSGG